MENKNMTTEQKLEQAMSLLRRVNLEEPPDAEFCRDLFLLTGDHMVRTDEGWEIPLAIDPEAEILDEVNA